MNRFLSWRLWPRRTSAWTPFALALLWLCLSPPGASAQDPKEKVANAPAAEAKGKEPEKDGGRPENGYWSVGKPRLFIATQSEIGGLYAKPYLSVGYGMPHWIWAGIDVNSITTLGQEQLYGGVRLATPVLSAQFGVKEVWSFSHPFLSPQKSFTAGRLDNAVGPNAQYSALEAEFVGVVPLPYSAFVADLTILYVTDAPPGKYVYEETYRVVTKDPLIYVLRTTAIARVLAEGALKIGVLGEFVFGTGREHPVIRMGPVILLQITDHLQAQAGVSVPVWSPDDLGIIASSFGLFGLTYKWASGERDPKLPWEGHIIP